MVDHKSASGDVPVMQHSPAHRTPIPAFISSSLQSLHCLSRIVGLFSREDTKLATIHVGTDPWDAGPSPRPVSVFEGAMVKPKAALQLAFVSMIKSCPKILLHERRQQDRLDRQVALGHSATAPI